MVTLLKNRYRIISNLSRGGFGETFLAEDTDMPSARRCVIKKLIPITNDSQIYQVVKERFGREAVILEKLGEGCSQIPSLYAYFEQSGHFYLVQEWIEGTTLQEKVKREGPLNENLVREILINILSVLEYVHSHHIVHRDIKPDNIILRAADMKPVLIDFGAVKESMGTVMATTGGTNHSIAIGTPGFMSSEQIAGRPVYASDLYSLGLTAIYLLTGKYPQAFATNAATGEILWRQDAPNISPALAVTLDKAIHANSRDRFLNAKEMLAALENRANTNPVNAPATITVSPASGNLSRVATASVAPAQGNSNLSEVNKNSGGLKDWQKATIVGSIIGTFLMGTFIVNSFLGRQSETQPISSNLPENSQVQPQEQNTPQIDPSPTTQPTQPSEPVVENSPIIQPIQPSEPVVENSPTIQPTQPSEPVVEDSPTTQPTQPSEPENSNPFPDRPQSDRDNSETKKPSRDRDNSETKKPSRDRDEDFTNAIDRDEAAELLEDLYADLSFQDFENAKLAYGPQLAAQFDPNFFKQFEEVTIENLQVISQTENSIDFIGENTYFYPDGSTQIENRSYTVRNLNGDLKVTDSKFIKVKKFR
jgi:serine/threonine-protein kinase